MSAKIEEFEKPEPTRAEVKAVLDEFLGTLSDKLDLEAPIEKFNIPGVYVREVPCDKYLPKIDITFMPVCSMKPLPTVIRVIRLRTNKIARWWLEIKGVPMYERQRRKNLKRMARKREQRERRAC